MLASCLRWMSKTVFTRYQTTRHPRKRDKIPRTKTAVAYWRLASVISLTQLLNEKTMKHFANFAKYVITFIVAIFLVGCASNTPLNLSQATLSKPSTLTITNRKAPFFYANTAGKSFVIGLIDPIAGSAIEVVEGRKIIRDHNMKDPAEKIETILSNELRAKYGVAVTKGSDVVRSIEVPQIAAKYSGADWILDIRTTYWGFGFYPLSLKRYWVDYGAKARLIDGRDKKIIASGYCPTSPKALPPTNAPTKDMLLANNAARLKSELEIETDKCIEQFKKEILRL